MNAVFHLPDLVHTIVTRKLYNGLRKQVLEGYRVQRLMVEIQAVRSSNPQQGTRKPSAVYLRTQTAFKSSDLGS